jgi:hypothetical protein
MVDCEMPGGGLKVPLRIWSIAGPSPCFPNRGKRSGDVIWLVPSVWWYFFSFSSIIAASSKAKEVYISINTQVS